MLETATAHFGGFDVLVNNAATLAGSAPLLETTDDEWRTSFEVNLLALTALIRASIPIFRGRVGGSIITIGSTASLGAEPGFGAYTAMKHGIVGLAQTVAAEFGADGIRSNVVCPGYIDTDMHRSANERLASEQGRSVEVVQQDRYATVPLGRAGSPAEVADVVALLAAPGGYVTGAVIPISGGVPYGI